MRISCCIHPKTEQGYLLESEFGLQYQETPWNLSDIEWKIINQGYYWVLVDGKTTLIYGREDVKENWSWVRWKKLRKAWNFMIEKLSIQHEGIGFSYTGSPEIWMGWLCCSPIRVNKLVNRGGTLASLAWQLEQLVPGSFEKFIPDWTANRYALGRILQS